MSSLAKHQWHIGGNVHVTIKRGWPYVDLREFWLPVEPTTERALPPNEYDVRPTRKGISLTFKQWDWLVQVMLCINTLSPFIAELQPCITDHHNQMGMLRCTHCNPNGWFMW